MARPPQSFSPPAIVVRAEQQVMSRSQVASTRRSIEDLRQNLHTVQNHLVNIRCNETNVGEVAQQLLAASRLREMLEDTAPVIQSALPVSSGARLNDRERQEILGLYQSGNYTQDRLAGQYGVSQTTIHNVVSDDGRNNQED